MPNLSPLAYGLLALALMGMIGTGVYKVKQWGADEVRAEWAEANRKAREKEQAQAAKAADTKEKGDQKARIVYRTITKTVDRIVTEPSYGKECLTEDGLSAARQAIRGELQEESKSGK